MRYEQLKHNYILGKIWPKYWALLNLFVDGKIRNDSSRLFVYLAHALCDISEEFVSEKNLSFHPYFVVK